MKKTLELYGKILTLSKNEPIYGTVLKDEVIFILTFNGTRKTINTDGFSSRKV